MTDSLPVTPDTQKRTRNQYLVRSTVLLMVLFGAAKAISLLQTFIIANAFGVSSEWDAYVAANRIPELIVVLISGGALGHAFIPIFSGYLAREKREAAWHLASHVVNVVFVVALLISAIVFVLAPWLVTQVIAPGFPPETASQTAEMMRLLLLATIIFAISGIVSSILHSHNHFLLPAIAPIMYDLGILFGVVVLLDPFGIHGVALGTVLGSLMHLGIQIPGLVRNRARWFPEMGLRDPVLWRVIQLMLPRIIGLGVFQFNMLVMNNIGSRLGVGAVSALDWGWRLMQIPQTLIGTAMGIVIFPTLAALSEMGDEHGKREAMSHALRFTIIASIPAAIGLIVIGPPLLSLLERGAFDSTASALIYTTLRAFTLGLVVHSMLEVVARSFYADKDTITPLWAALAGAGINLVLSFMLSGVNEVNSSYLITLAGTTFDLPGSDMIRGNVSGLALANSLGVTFEVLILLFILRKRWHGIQEAALARAIIKTLTASLIMALAVLGVEMLWIATGFSGSGFITTAAQVGIQALVGLIVFVISAWLLRLEELRDLLKLMRRSKQSTTTEEQVYAD